MIRVWFRSYGSAGPSHISKDYEGHQWEIGYGGVLLLYKDGKIEYFFKDWSWAERVDD